MTRAIVSPVIPSGGRRRQASPLASTLHRALPLPAVRTDRDHHLVYGMAAVDRRGRVADQAVVRALGWAPGTRLDMREAHGLLVVQASPQGIFAVTRQGHLRLPADARHCVCLAPGDRVLLVADPGGGRLVVHPPAVLDLIVTRLHTELLGGDQ